MAFVTMFQMNMVAAATSQGLSWGFVVGDQFNYQMKLIDIDEADTIDEGIYIKVNERPDIPNIVTNWSQIPIITIEINFNNGTSIGILGLVLYPLVIYYGGLFALPIGNFSLIQKLHSDQGLENLTYINTYYYWGVKYEGQASGNTISGFATYLKSDGFLAKYTLTARNSTHTLGEVSVIRKGLPSDLQDTLMSNILLIGAGVVALIIIGAIVCKKK